LSKSEIDDLLKRIKDLEKKVDLKVDTDIFKNEVASLRELIGNNEHTDDKVHAINA
jgi:hypothetical protein